MDEIVDLLFEIRRLAEGTSPVIHDLSQEALDHLSKNNLYTMDEIMKMLDRRDDA